MPAKRGAGAALERLLPILAAVLFVSLAIANVTASGRADLPLLFGDRRDAMFDLWSLQHFCGGVLIGSILMRTSLASLGTVSFLLLSLLVALSWEAAELAMEAGWFGQAVSDWKDGYEHWGNRLIGDPLMVTTGCLLGRRTALAWKIVVVPAALWLVLNVTSPSSMSIQRELFGTTVRAAAVAR